MGSGSNRDFRDAEGRDKRSREFKEFKRRKRVQKALDFCQVQIIIFLTRMPATMSIGRHLMRLQLFQGICFMNISIIPVWGSLWQNPKLGLLKILIWGSVSVFAR